MDRYAIRLRNQIDADNNTLTFERSGKLKQLVFTCQGEDFDAVADNAIITVELNPRAAQPNTGATENFTATLVSLYLAQDFLTTGGSGLHAELVVPLDEKISIGDRLRIYAAVTGGGNVSCQLIAYIS